MKFSIASATILYYFSPASASSSCQDLDTAYPSQIPFVEYQNEDFIFTRQKYNSVCVDSRGNQFEYGEIAGIYPPINEPESGCSTACVKGVSVDQARGCNQRPPSNKLVGFEYDCSRATCKCLYEAGTLGNQYSQCFDDMNTSNKGTGEVDRTTPQQGETCYSLYIQSNNPPPSPTPPVGTGICSYAPDYNCYSDGHPPCCKEDGGRNCPNYLTMCNNHAQGMSGFDYCTNAPDYQCYNTSNGHPSCCNEPGGSYMNCPKAQPACDGPPGPPGPPQPKGGPPKMAFESFRRVGNVQVMKGQQMQAPHKTEYANTNYVKQEWIKGQQKQAPLQIKGFKDPQERAAKRKFYLRNN